MGRRLMASNLMAAFGQDFVETNIMSESNQVKYWMELAATHANAVPNEHIFRINQKDVGGAPERGINIWRINNDSADNAKTFDLTNDDSTMNKAFVEYMGQQQSGLYVLMTNGRCLTSPIVNAWFASKKSVVWPEPHFTVDFPNSAYCAIFAAGKNSILYESFIGNDGKVKEDSRAKLDTVYDNVGGVGMCGFPLRTFEDNTTYKDTAGYEYRRYPEQDKTISKLSDFNLQQNLWVRMTCDLYASQVLLNAGSTTRMDVRWFNNNTLISSTSLEVPNDGGNRWLRFESDFRIPSGCNGFTAVVARYPKTTVAAESGVQNVVMTQISDATGEQGRTSGEFGVNGIRMMQATEGGNNGSTTIFEIPNTNIDKSGIRHAKEFRELGARM